MNPIVSSDSPCVGNSEFSSRNKTENNAMEIIYTGDKRSTGVCIAEPAGCSSLNISHPAGALANNISPKRRRVSNDEKNQVAEYLKSNFNPNLNSESVTGILFYLISIYNRSFQQETENHISWKQSHVFFLKPSVTKIFLVL
jgi:hypothetical protein